MNELSLFSGAGGGLLGTKLLGWRHVGYVEYERYCQQVIAQRIKDGILSEAPIFGDVREFVQSGAAKKYKGFVDVVTAGFPCQPFSVAGKRKGKEDERNMWPSTIQIIRDVQPRYALLENVPGLLNSGYFQEILGSLAQARYDAKWIVLGADDVGAPHRRKRLWIKATSQDPKRGRCVHWEHEEERVQVREQWEPGSGSRERVLREASKLATDTNSISMGWDERTGETVRSQIQEPEGQESQHIWEDISQTRNVADTSNIRLEEHGHSQAEDVIERGKEVPNASSERLEGWESSGRESEEHSSSSGSCWWSTEPNVGRVANGVASRVDRLKAIGNGQVPLVVAQAWEILK
jgi:DNA (cytosine-5)-methyltransferase 1